MSEGAHNDFFTPCHRKRRARGRGLKFLPLAAPQRALICQNESKPKLQQGPKQVRSPFMHLRNR